ncbi:hypothetical protein EPO05_03140 [Patescibacteria group bacterium]|nr:MAG: hypothetical protein EPO05_03140 [Patescibacteria group bacterium]
MKIAICASLDFINEIKDVADQLVKLGHAVTLPQTAEKIYRGEATHEQIMKEKASGEIAERGIRQDSLKYYFGKIQAADAVLVLNLKKKDVEGYVGGAVFLEMGFAHVLGKPIFLFNAIPQMPYTDEIRMMQPVVLAGDLGRIR